jgi:hypothetical protein
MPDTPTAKSISELTTQDLADYIRLTPTEDDTKLLATILQACKDYVVKFTGQTIEALDNYKDVTIAVYVLAQDMWDNRAYYVDNSNVNKVVEAILGLHSINLL